MSAADRLATLSPDARAATLAALDDLSRPLTIRDLDLALALAGVPRSQRRPAIRALHGLDIIAVRPR